MFQATYLNMCNGTVHVSFASSIFYDVHVIPSLKHSRPYLFVFLQVNSLGISQGHMSTLSGAMSHHSLSNVYGHGTGNTIVNIICL